MNAALIILLALFGASIIASVVVAVRNCANAHRIVAEDHHVKDYALTEERVSFLRGAIHLAFDNAIDSDVDAGKIVSLVNAWENGQHETFGGYLQELMDALEECPSLDFIKLRSNIKETMSDTDVNKLGKHAEASVIEKSLMLRSICRQLEHLLDAAKP